MNFDYERLNQWGPQIDHILDTVPYPIEKDELVLRAQQTGLNRFLSGHQEVPQRPAWPGQDVACHLFRERSPTEKAETTSVPGVRWPFLPPRSFFSASTQHIVLICRPSLLTKK
jgi:hypothetical protein